MSTVAEHARLKLQIANLEAKCQRLADDVKRMRELLWTVQVAGTGYLWRMPDGTTKTLDPIDVVMVVANDDKVPDVERLTAQMNQLTIERDNDREILGRERLAYDRLNQSYRVVRDILSRTRDEHGDLIKRIRNLAASWDADSSEIMSHCVAQELTNLLEDTL